MSADYEVDVSAVLGNLHVAWHAFSTIVPDVRPHHHTVGKPRSFEVFRQLKCHRSGVVILQRTEAFVGNQAFRTDVDANKRHALVAHMLDNVGLKDAFARRAGEVVVRADFVGTHIAVVFGYVADAVVKLMVAHDYDVVAETVERRIFHIAAEHRKKHSALHCVAGMHRQHIGVGSTHAVHNHACAHQSATTVLVGHNGAVSVVRRQDGEVLGLGCDAKGEGSHDCYSELFHCFHCFKLIRD